MRLDNNGTNRQRHTPRLASIDEGSPLLRGGEQRRSENESASRPKRVAFAVMPQLSLETFDHSERFNAPVRPPSVSGDPDADVDQDIDDVLAHLDRLHTTQRAKPADT